MEKNKKTEDIRDLINWINSNCKKHTKRKIKYDYDKIIYGVSRDTR